MYVCSLFSFFFIHLYICIFFFSSKKKKKKKKRNPPFFFACMYALTSSSLAKIYNYIIIIITSSNNNRLNKNNLLPPTFPNSSTLTPPLIPKKKKFKIKIKIVSSFSSPSVPAPPNFPPFIFFTGWLNPAPSSPLFFFFFFKPLRCRQPSTTIIPSYHPAAKDSTNYPDDQIGQPRTQA